MLGVVSDAWIRSGVKSEEGMESLLGGVNFWQNFIGVCFGRELKIVGLRGRLNLIGRSNVVKVKYA